MASRRTLKVAEAIREVVATSVLTDLKDPRVQFVTITKVEATADLRQAKVYFTARGDEAKEKLALKGLQSAAGFLQQKCARRIDTRYTPTLLFAVDEGIKNLLAVTRILADERAKSDVASEDVASEDEVETREEAEGTVVG